MVEVQKEDIVNGTRRQLRCTKCHKLRSRVTRIIASANIEGYSELAGDGRKDFMKNAANLFGAELQKVLVESITKARMDRQIVSFTQEGEAQDFTEAEEEFKNKPEEWGNILKHGHQFTCPVRQVLQIVAKPKLE